MVEIMTHTGGSNAIITILLLYLPQLAVTIPTTDWKSVTTTKHLFRILSAKVTPQTLQSILKTKTKQ